MLPALPTLRQLRAEVVILLPALTFRAWAGFLNPMLSQKTRYTIRAFQHLADRWGQGPVRLQDIAEAQNIPRKFLTVIMAEMTREGLLVSHRGRDGGYVRTGAFAGRYPLWRSDPPDPR